MPRVAGQTDAVLRLRDAAIRDMIRSGKTTEQIKAATGLTANAILKVATKRAWTRKPYRRWYDAKQDSVIGDETAWSAVDEGLDDDEQYGPLRRCRCDLVLFGSETACGECLSTEYAFRAVNGKRDNNHAVGVGFDSSSHYLMGAKGERPKKRKEKHAHTGAGTASAPSSDPEPVTEGLGAAQEGA